MDTKPAFCATCVEERSDLTRAIRKGRTVWLCPDCRDPLGELRQFEIADKADSYGHALGKDGGRRTRTGRSGT